MQSGAPSLTHLANEPIYSRSSVLTTNCPWHLLAAENSVLCWRDTTGSVWFALGQHAEFDSPLRLQDAVKRVQCIDSDMAPRGFGIVAFDAAQSLATPWHRFPARRFVLPECLVRWQEGKATILVMSTSHDPLVPLMRRVTTMLTHPAYNHSLSSDILDEQELFSREDWRRAVSISQAHIRREQLQKIVLARHTELRFADEVNPIAVLESLSEANHDSAVFAYRLRGAGVFLGATPERLFTLRRGHVAADSMAGTRPRGTETEEDRRLADDLSHSEKDRLEQRLVTNHVVQQMQTICEDVIVESAPRVRKLNTVQHLATVVEGIVREETTLDDILSALHPTPATCGAPIETARQLIAELEPQTRGLYAGAIGWVEAERAEFAVAIRSGLIQGNTARIFGGAGIVAASDADAEYDECEWKMLPLRRALRAQA